MAERRMFAKTIIDSDAFIDMPVTARLLYYDLAMRADDDGFVNSPKKIMRMIGASQDDLSVLIMKKFIIPFESGVVVIKHWRIHNYIRKDTYNSTPYKDEIESLELDENKAYRLKRNDRGRGVDEPWTQDRLGKVSIELDKDIIYNAHSESDSVPIETPKPDYEIAFEEVWKLYPSKKGKSKVSKKALTEMQKSGWDVVKKAVENYKAEMDRIRRGGFNRQYMDGSTFFNGSWKDWVNVEAVSDVPDYNKPTSERNYDNFYELLEKKVKGEI